MKSSEQAGNWLSERVTYSSQGVWVGSMFQE